MVDAGFRLAALPKAIQMGRMNRGANRNYLDTVIMGAQRAGVLAYLREGTTYVLKLESENRVDCTQDFQQAAGDVDLLQTVGAGSPGIWTAAHFDGGKGIFFVARDEGKQSTFIDTFARSV
ncbi:hypothetical protein Ddc_02393 [Ditylenchus destructor]|nr:hypothetical protein Ddc_02393 [Ditylenchus destructor]